MRSRLPKLAPAAWLAVAGLGMFDPVGQAWSMPDIVSICSGGGSRLIELPAPGHGQKRENCVKGCHALCQRKRAGQSESGETKD